DRVETNQRVELLTLVALLTFTGHPHRAGDRITAAQPVLAHHVHRDVHVVRAGEVAGRADERVVVEDVEDAGDRLKDIVLADLGFARVRAAVAAIASAATLAEATAPAAATAVVVV